ncbi:MAG TPA: hypothetical protein VN363_01870 [Anaerolineales bacterium]|nr:hypothetical protein [Anaerolineales bacterium]
MAGIAVFTSFGPAEKTLGTNVRIVYLHGAWVWAALVSFGAAAASGLLGLLTRQFTWHTWSQALGRTGLFFWITYLPISLWAMQTNWNGLFMSEPRWRLAVIFSITGLLLQIGLSLVRRPVWTSLANAIYFTVLLVVLQTTDQVLHPASPILTSEVVNIQIYFISLVALTVLAAWQVARWWRCHDTLGSKA